MNYLLKKKKLNLHHYVPSECILYFLGLFLSSPPMCMFCLCMCIGFITSLRPTQSGSQLSVNQDTGDSLLAAGSPVVEAVTDASMNPHIALEDTPLPGYTSPSCTPLPLELHIDEDGSAPSSSRCSTVIIASSKNLQYSHVQQKDNGDTVTSEISHMESFLVSSTLKPLSDKEANSPTPVSGTKESNSAGAAAESSDLVVSSSPVTASKISSPIFRPKNTSLPDDKSKSPVHNNLSPVPVSQSPQVFTKSNSQVTDSPITEAVPKTASPLTVPAVSSPLPILKSAGSDTVPKCASPVTIPRLSSPVPKNLSLVTAPMISSSQMVPKTSETAEMVPRISSPVMLLRLSSPVTVPKSESVLPKSPATLIRKKFTNPSTSSPRASPVSAAAVPSHNTYTPGNQGGDVLDITWPCREPLLDDALDKLLTPDSARLTENQPTPSVKSGDDDRSWEDEDGIYPDLSRAETLTPMTESSWMEECFTPSTCPGTPDASLDLPLQQPSAVERLSASGQVGNLTLPK